jgi:maltose alpha-D-glucosyltransferase/alpha-amylase
VGADALLALFELEKLVYEVRYELLNRPDWADIPLGALARQLGVEADGALGAGGAPAGAA